MIVKNHKTGLFKLGVDIMKEILAECLNERAEGYIVTALTREFPTVQDLMNADKEEIRKIKGIGAVKAKKLLAILSFVKLVNSPNKNISVFIKSPKDVYELLRCEIEYLQKEQFMVIGLGVKNQVICKEVVSVGILDASIVHPRETFRTLIKRACARCLLVHNHPSGDTTPSKDDIKITARIVNAGKILGIEVLDHVIIGMNNYLSFREKGMLKNDEDEV